MQSILNLERMTTESQMIQILRAIKKALFTSNSFNRFNALNLLKALLINLQNPKSAPQSKFQTIMIIKCLTQSNQIQFLKQLANHPIFKFLYDLVICVDPKLSIDQKGKRLFSYDEELGNQYIRLVLELFKWWAEKFPKDNPHNITVFWKILNQLNKDNVKLPLQYQFININRHTKSPSYTFLTEESFKLQNNLNTKLQSNIIYIQKFINGINRKLADIQSFNSIKQFHRTIDKDLTQYTKLNDFIDSQKNEIKEKFYRVVSFMNTEADLYRNYFLKMNYNSYYDGIKENMKKIVSQGDNGYLNDEDTLQVNTISFGPNQILKHKKLQQTKQYTQYSVSKDQHKNILKNPNLGSKNDTLNILPQKTQSSASSCFKQFHRSLVGQKIEHTSKARSKSKSINSIYRSNTYSSEANTILNTTYSTTEPPNRNLKAKLYDGKLIMSNLDLNRSLNCLKTNIQLRYFRLANLKNKNKLFEDSSIQIGCKTISSKQDACNQTIRLQLYIGNQSYLHITDLDVSFEGDENVQIYSSPLIIQSRIQPNCQLKIQLVIVIKRYPYKFVKMKVHYENKNKKLSICSLMPNSILKLTEFRKLHISEFQQFWNSKLILYKTQLFTLTSHFPPKKILQYLPSFQALSEIEDFLRQGSTQDYQIYSSALIVRYLAGIKIIIRPNYQCLIQVGIQNSSLEAEKYCRFFLQNFQIILSQIQV